MKPSLVVSARKFLKVAPRWPLSISSVEIRFLDNNEPRGMIGGSAGSFRKGGRRSTHGQPVEEVWEKGLEGRKGTVTNTSVQRRPFWGWPSITQGLRDFVSFFLVPFTLSSRFFLTGAVGTKTWSRASLSRTLEEGRPNETRQWRNRSKYVRDEIAYTRIVTKLSRGSTTGHGKTGRTGHWT